MRTAGAWTSAPALLPSPWVQTFLHSIKIKPIVSSLVKAHASGNVPPLPSLLFSNVLNFTTARSQEAATHFSAPWTRERQVPRAPSFPVARCGSSGSRPQARRRRELCPCARRFACPPAAGQQLCPPPARPVELPRAPVAPAAPLLPCAGTHGRHGAPWCGVRQVRECGRCAERLRRRGRALGRWEARPRLSPATAYSIPVLILRRSRSSRL